MAFMVLHIILEVNVNLWEVNVRKMEVTVQEIKQEMLLSCHLQSHISSLPWRKDYNPDKSE